MSEPRPAEATITLPGAPRSGPPPRSYLLRLDRSSSQIVPLPRSGALLVGRSPAAQVPLSDPSASREHARLICAGGSVTLVDLGSHNGTFVNGERLAGPRRLVSGDVVSVGELTLVLHRDAGLPETRALLGEPALRERLEQEIARCAATGCTLGLLCLAGPPGSDAAAWLPAIEAAAVLGAMDCAGVTAGRLVILLPERSLQDAADLAGRLRSLEGPAPGVSFGGWPQDGIDADQLLSTLLCAAARAAPREVVPASALVEERRIGGERVLLADPAMLQTYALLDRLAPGDLPVLILGETGTGKELAAALLHERSGRQGPLVPVNCAALPESLVEGELFGHVRGAFSGAASDRPGLLEAAHGGTLLLDEIGELPLGAQAKLLRALETRRVRRIGDLHERPVDVRLVCATHRDLRAEVLAGRFRQDLLYRLGAAQVSLPPLRERPRELAALARRFLAAACARAGRPAPELSAPALQGLHAHRWPGNVRELKNVMEYVASTCEDRVVAPWHLPPLAGTPGPAPATVPAQDPARGPRFRPLDEELRALERSRMIEALRAAGGVQARAAELLSVPVWTFTGKIRLYGLLDLANTRHRPEPDGHDGR